MRSISSERAAMMMASMSSWPGSQSSQTFFLIQSYLLYPSIYNCMNIQTSSENKALLDRMRGTYNELKSNYVDFLNSLRY